MSKNEILKKYFNFRNLSIKNQSRRSRNVLAQNEIDTIFFLLEKFYNFKNLNEIKILDVGCGDKFLEPVLKKKNFFYEGIDINRVDFNVDKLPYDDNSFDIVISLAVIEHIKIPENYLSEIYRVLKNNNGLLFLSTPNWIYSHKDFYNDYTHVRPYTKVSLTNILSDFNFIDIHVVPGLRKKPFWQYTIPYAEFFAKNLPFTGDATFVPNILKGKARSLFAMAKKST